MRQAPAVPQNTPRMPAQQQPQAPAAAAPGGTPTLPPGFELEQAPAAPPPRQVGVLETMGRTAASAAIPIVRSIDMAAAGLAGMLAPLLGMNAEQEQAKVFRDSEARSARMRQQYEPQAGEQMSGPGQLLGGVASMPLEMVGGMGAQRGIERSADVLQRGGTGGEAALAGAVTGGANVVANLLPVKAGGVVGRAVESTLARGIGQRAAQVGAGALTGGAIGAASDAAVTGASNAALPEGEEFAGLRQESDPLTSFGLGAAFGGAAGRAQNRGGRKAAQAAGEPMSAAEAAIAPAEKAPSIDPETVRLAQKARAYGIPLRPDMLSDSKIAKYVGDVLEKVPLGGSKAPERQKAFNRAVMDQLGADAKAEALTPEVFDEAISRAGKEIGALYEKTPIPAESFGDLNTVARRELGEVQQVVKGYADDLAGMAGADGMVPGDKLRKLRTEAATQAKSTANGDLRNTLGKLVDRLDDALEKHAEAGDMESLRDARRRYAVAKTLEPLVAKSATGDISPAALMRMVTNNRAGKSRMARGRGGELGDLARIGQKFLKEPPSSGTAERLAAGGAVAGVGTGALLAPGAAATAAGAIGAANLYNRLGPGMVDRKLAKLAPQELVEPGALPEAAAEPAAPVEAVAPKDARLTEIDRLRAGASPETLKVLDEHAKVVQQDIKAQEVKAQRDAEALKLEATAAKTTDPGIKAALIERANKLRSEKIPVAEAQELTSIPIETTKQGRIPAGKATELAEVPGPSVREPSKPLPVGAAREVTVIDQQPAAPIEPTQIPTGEATELTPEQVEPAPRPTEAPRSAAGSDTEAELTMLQEGAPAKGAKKQGSMFKLVGTTPGPKKSISDLPRDMREELFNLHASYVNPNATESRFYAKRVPSGVIKLDGIKVEQIPDAQLSRYQKVEAMPPIVIADGRLIDGQHRIAAARRDGVKELPYIDLTGLLDTKEGGYISDLPNADDLKRAGAKNGMPAKPFKQRAELENALRAKLGHKLVDGLQKRNVITMGDAPADVPRDAQGRFTGSTVELFHDRLDAATAPGVLMHEVGMHYGMEKMLGEQRYAELLKDIAKMRQRPEVAKAWQAVKDNYDLKEGSPEFVSEVAAHLVETAPDRPIVRRMLDGPRAYLYSNFGVNVGRMDPGLVQALAVGALRKSAGVEAVSPNPTALATAGAREQEKAEAQ
jgi:hypothetical protein